MTPEQFKQARKSLGWSISDCARHILHSERNIRRMELGQRPVMPQTKMLMEMYLEKARK